MNSLHAFAGLSRQLADLTAPKQKQKKKVGRPSRVSEITRREGYLLQRIGRLEEENNMLHALTNYLQNELAVEKSKSKTLK